MNSFSHLGLCFPSFASIANPTLFHTQFPDSKKQQSPGSIAAFNWFSCFTCFFPLASPLNCIRPSQGKVASYLTCVHSGLVQQGARKRPPYMCVVGAVWCTLMASRSGRRKQPPPEPLACNSGASLHGAEAAEGRPLALESVPAPLLESTQLHTGSCVQPQAHS